MEEENVIICPSCGAKLLATEAQCPYCGQTNAKGAEYQYMGKLYHMVDDMEDMEDDAVCATLESGKSGAKFIGIVVGLSVMLAIVIMTINIVMARVDDRESQKEWEWRITWVPVFNELYEQGEYRQLADLYYESTVGTDCYYSYEHGEFIHVWEQVMEALDIMESIEAGTAYEYQYRELFRTEIEFYDMNNHSYLMEKDRLILTELCEPLRADLMTRWGLTQEELEEYLDELQENYGYMSSESLDAFMEDWFEENGGIQE